MCLFFESYAGTFPVSACVNKLRKVNKKYLPLYYYGSLNLNIVNTLVIYKMKPIWNRIVCNWLISDETVVCAKTVQGACIIIGINAYFTILLYKHFNALDDRIGP